MNRSSVCDEKRFFDGGHTPYLSVDMKEASIIRDRPQLRNKVELMLACEIFGPSRGMGNTSVLIAGDGEHGSVL